MSSAAALAAWLAGAATSNRAIAPPSSIAAAADRHARRRARERNRAAARTSAADRDAAQPGRNLFAFRVARGRAAGADRRAAAPALVEAPPLPPPPPPLKLAGIAEDAGADGPVRTAIISGDGQLFMVKEGESVTPRYRVAKISADVVELIDLDDSTYDGSR